MNSRSHSFCRAQEHLPKAKGERTFYQLCCKENQVQCLGPHAAVSLKGKIYYSFDVDQQIHFPYNPKQPQPTYFKPPWKCAVFGDCCESLPQQIIYILLMKPSLHGREKYNPKSITSEFYRISEAEVDLHADNCVGQNKHSAMLHYLTWMVLSGSHAK